jgi:hypothetical protein
MALGMRRMKGYDLVDPWWDGCNVGQFGVGLQAARRYDRLLSIAQNFMRHQRRSYPKWPCINIRDGTREDAIALDRLLWLNEFL